MKYKCIKEYRKKLSNNTVLVFTEGVTYSQEQVTSRVAMPMIPEYFKELDDTQDLGYGGNSESMFNTLIDQIKDTHERKNHDYGNSFAKSMDKYGLTAAAIRLGDKFNRFESLIKSKAQVKDESIEDTLLDMAAYAIMTVEYIKEKKSYDTI